MKTNYICTLLVRTVVRAYVYPLVAANSILHAWLKMRIQTPLHGPPGKRRVLCSSQFASVDIVLVA